VPDSHLDARPDYYPELSLDVVTQTDASRLLKSYFEIIHSSLPLIDPAQFELSSRPSTLIVAAVYLLAAPFCNINKVYSPILQFMQQALPIEARHPKLETVEAALLFMQRQALYHRAPTTPGLWSDVGSVSIYSHLDVRS
jgi:hypothetical protein